MPFYVSYRENSGALARLESFDTSGASLTRRERATSGEAPWAGWRLRPAVGSIIGTPTFNEDAKRYDVDTLAAEWAWTPDDPTFQGYDSQDDGSGGAWVLRPANETLHHVDNSGTEVTQYDLSTDASWPDDPGAALADVPVSLALNQDATIALLLTRNGQLVGWDLSAGGVLWTLTLDATAYNVPNTQAARFTITRIPGTNAFVAAIAREGAGSYRVGVLCRLDFSAALTTAPTITWAVDWTDIGIEFNRYITAISVSETAIYAGGYASNRTAGGDPHIVTKYDLDGNVQWRVTGSGYTTDTYVEWGCLAHSGDYIIVGTGDNEVDFTGSWWGFQRYDASTGSAASAGVFPLAVYDMFSATSDGVSESDPLAPNSSDTTTRVYSNVSRTAGSLLEALDAPAVEDGIRMGFFETEDLVRGELVPFHEALAPSETRLRFYPYPVPSLERLNEFAGGTKLGRMTRAYPSRFVAAAADLPLGTATGTLTPQNLLAELFNAWEREFDWFTYKAPLPDLRYRTVTGDYSSAEAGLVTFDAIVLEQEDTNRLSMRAILDRFLALFPGTAILMDSEGDIVLRPLYGPDAPASSTLTLSEADLVSISTGDADPRGVYNRARVRTRGGSIQDGVAVVTDLTAVFGWDQRVDDWEAYLDAQSLIDSSYELIPRNQFRDWDAAIVRGDEVTLDIAISLYALVWDGSPFDAGSSITSHTLEASDSWTSVTVPFGGAVTRRIEDKYEEGLFGGGGWDIWADIQIEANAERGISIRAIDTNLGETDGSPWATFAAVVEIANVTGDGYDVNLETIVGEFGFDGETLLDGSGSDILAPSVDTWGERELDINAEAFSCSPAQAAELAQALVLHHINPVTIRTCEQAWSRGYRVTPDHVGLQVDLPNTEVGIVQRRDYSDDYRDPYAPQLSSVIEVAITEQAYASDGLLLTNGGAFLFTDAGTQLELDNG